MSVQAILAPVFALVLLAFGLLLWMGRARFAAARTGEVTTNKGSPRTFGWPQKAQQVSDCFHNQLELPVFFYLLVVFAMMTDDADLLFVVMSWLFVATRYAHAFVHTGSNRLKQRFPLYMAGAVLLMAMWLIYAARILFSL